jgi:dipeptidase E
MNAGTRRLLLLSNSTAPGGGYLAWARDELDRFFGGKMRRVFFVPFAGVIRPWDEYAAVVGSALAPLGCEVVSAHAQRDPAGALATCDAIAVGGGNTFQLLARLRERQLLTPIRDAALAGKPYVGWSAGSNLACPTIRTTNDMPIVDVPSLAALDLVPFQVNAHYTEARLTDHGGESRVERLTEFVHANPGVTVVALPEGTALRVEGNDVTLIGSADATVSGLNGGPTRMDAAGVRSALSAER